MGFKCQGWDNKPFYRLEGRTVMGSKFVHMADSISDSVGLAVDNCLIAWEVIDNQSGKTVNRGKLIGG